MTLSSPPPPPTPPRPRPDHAPAPQLDETVSRLQTAFALCVDDPVTKLRELREENDALRAELCKLQVHSPTSSYLDGVPVPVPVQLHTPPSDAPDALKWRRLFPFACMPELQPTPARLQLEEPVSKLQTALGFSIDDIAKLRTPRDKESDDDGEEIRRKVTKLKRPSSDAVAKFEDYREQLDLSPSKILVRALSVIPYVSDEQADASTKNPHIVYRPVKFHVLDDSASDGLF